MGGGGRLNCGQDGRPASDEVYVYNMCLPAVMVGFTSVRRF